MTETRNITTEELIAVTYSCWTIETGERWMRIETLAGLLERDDLNDVITELVLDETSGFRAEPQPFGHRLTAWDREHAPIIGGEARHLIWWE